MKIGLIDSDLIYNNRHNFPNLALMKISSYHKQLGHDAKLISYSEVSQESLFSEIFDKIYIAKVFTNTIVPTNILKLPNVKIGGTGFFYDNANHLQKEIEFIKPDYNLYNNWIETLINKGKPKEYFKYYNDYSIGFTTRGCFRKCEFCVNINSNKSIKHSSVVDFVDLNKKKICLLDDNLFACGDWENILNQLKEIDKPFQYKQGLDIRLLSEKKAKILSELKYDSDFIFAFDNIKDSKLIENKFKIYRNYLPTKQAKAYVFCGFDRQNKYDKAFWKNDIIEIFERLKILNKYQIAPYLMRHENYKNSPFAKFYTILSSWCNTPQIYKRMSMKEYHKESKVFQQFQINYPEIDNKYFNNKF